MKKNAKTFFACQSCGYRTPKWMGKCPECGGWDTLVEERAPVSAPRGSPAAFSSSQTQPVPIDAIELAPDERMRSGINEFDRVLGGGIVPGTLVLIGGDPGIGKSTLMLQALYGLAMQGLPVLYVSGEESIRQIRMRSMRLSTTASKLMVVSEIDLESILAMMEKTTPAAVVIDSIQTMFNSDLTSAPGSVSQVRESALRLMLAAKKTGVPVFLVGHVTKDGAIAGPRVLEHMVDTVLYFEGDRNHVFRVLRAVKNRFGSTNEIGVFEMRDKGLEEVPNPSAVFLAERPGQTAGSAVTACMEGTRPVLVEFQALVSSTSFGNPRRTVLGLDANRVALLTAVMEKKLGMHLMGHDIFMNVAGGVKVAEPGVDLGVISAVASSFLDKPITDNTVVFGEVGLTGEVRPIGQAEARVAEITKMGFQRCVLPAGNLSRVGKHDGVVLHGVKTIEEAVAVLF